MYDGTDHYAVLGLAPSADDVVVHAAWKALLRKYHPDANPGAQSGARAREINEAFAVLGKPEMRARYDRARSQPPVIAQLRNPPPSPGAPHHYAPARRRMTAIRLFGAALLILGAIPIAITTLLAFPSTAPETRRAPASASAGNPFARDLASRLDLLASVLSRDPAATDGDTDTDTTTTDTAADTGERKGAATD